MTLTILTLAYRERHALLPALLGLPLAVLAVLVCLPADLRAGRRG